MCVLLIVISFYVFFYYDVLWHHKSNFSKETIQYFESRIKYQSEL